MDVLVAAVLPTVVKAEPNGIFQLLAKLNPPRNIDDATWSQMTFVERVRNYNYTLELVALGISISYLFFQYASRGYNKSAVKKFMKRVKPSLATEFAQVGVTSKKLLQKDSPCRFTTYATGRENVEGMIMRFRLKDRYNLVPFISSFFNPSLGSVDGLGDHVDLTITPFQKQKIGPGIFSVVNKQFISELQAACYFYKITKLADNAQLPSAAYALMLEHGDQTKLLLTDELLNALALPGADKILRFMAISDIGVKEPETYKDLEPEPVVTVSMSFPTTEEEFTAASKLILAAIHWVDILTESEGFGPGAVKKIQAARDVEHEKITKRINALKQEELDQKKAEERREAARKERNLSEKEQRALQKKEERKQSRKQRQRMTRKA